MEPQDIAVDNKIDNKEPQPIEPTEQVEQVEEVHPSVQRAIENSTDGRKKGWKNLKPVKKGEIRNPKGRPKIGESFKELLDRFGKLAIKKNKSLFKLTMKDLPPEILKEIRTVKHLAAFRLLIKAATGDLKAVEMLMDRAEGKPSQTIATIDLTPKPLFEEDDKLHPFGFQPDDEAREDSESEEPTEGADCE